MTRILLFIFTFIILTGFVIKAPNTKNFQILPTTVTTSEIDAVDFSVIVSEVYALYAKDNIKVNLLWEKPYFTAFAKSEGIDLYSINFWGGLARIPSMLKETWAFVVCHELGHIIGGKPFLTIKDYKWASSEGQSDHFAANDCLPKYFDAKFLGEFDDRNFMPYEIGYCSDHHEGIKDLFICLKILRAGRGFVDVNQYMKVVGDYDFETSAPATQEMKINSYPSLQCRIDILKSAAKSIQNKRNNCWFIE